MASRSSNPSRRAPQQERSTLRVQAILQVAEDLFAARGFEATTMTEVAEAAGSSIGSLYSYFPDKKALALALLDIYGAQIESHWQPLFAEIETLDAKAFSTRFIDRFLDFLTAHPAYLQLQNAPVKLRRSASAKKAFRASLIDALQRRVPSLGHDAAELHVLVLLQIVSGMMQLYPDATAVTKPAVVREFKAAIAAYVGTFFR
ncbi:TetR/AcrR family transcriptional regulator [Granulicella cerasi]|uniref:TetR/AcrR family transcriptional regulator n=1 Tax=Granulicella cerasi TaxID=741063 RepID=A0ABW1ZDB0_9BACT|nr:TetR/AcrR family transcriptional regulator [Granulicella cerasi]